jgi:multicomponent K+:H+ antiporter subunit F
MTTGVLALALDISVAAVSVAMLLCAWRLVRGPQSIDRVLAVDTLYLNTVALVLLLGMRMQTQLLFEAALIVAMLGFAATVGLARYISRGDVIE